MSKDVDGKKGEVKEKEKSKAGDDEGTWEKEERKGIK